MEKACMLQLKRESLKKLELKFCGYSECESLHSFGPASRPTYILHIVLEGKGIFVVDNKKYFLEKGQGFIIEPNIVTFYQADAKNPWKYFWIGFDGEGAEKYLRELGIIQHKPIFRTDKLDELFSLLKEMLKRKNLTLAEELKLQGLFYEFFSLIVEENSIEEKDEKNELNPYVDKIITYIKNNYWDDINVNNIIEYVGLNRSYLSTLFKKNIGITIQEYLTVFRLSRANELLDITNESIENVANSCGYKDPLVFTKAYKKKYGVTPTQHRKKDRKEAKENLIKYGKRIQG